MKEHLHTRAPSSASLFDVSHMGQIRWHGKDAVKFIEEMVVGDIASLKEGQAKLSLIMNEDGGIVDDTVIANAGSFIYMVVNGGCKVIRSYETSLSANILEISSSDRTLTHVLVEGHGSLQEISEHHKTRREDGISG